MFTGTPEFFDSRQGVAGLAALDARIQFSKQGGFASLRQPQLELRPFDAERLRSVAVRLRELYPARDRDLLLRKVDDSFITQLVDKVTAGFRGEVGVVPRQFLRAFVDVLDLVEQEDDFDPKRAYEFQAKEPTPEEQSVPVAPSSASDESEAFVPKEDIW
jgi:hypothetical protein